MLSSRMAAGGCLWEEEGSDIGGASAAAASAYCFADSHLVPATAVAAAPEKGANVRATGGAAGRGAGCQKTGRVGCTSCTNLRALARESCGDYLNRIAIT